MTITFEWLIDVSLGSCGPGPLQVTQDRSEILPVVSDTVVLILESLEPPPHLVYLLGHVGLTQNLTKSKKNNKKRKRHKTMHTKVAFHLSFLASRKELVLASLNGKSKARAYVFPATTLQIPALWPTGAGELSGSDPWAGLFWPESVLRTRAFHSRADWSDRTDRTSGMWP